jgi:hypothetical protein
VFYPEVVTGEGRRPERRDEKPIDGSRYWPADKPINYATPARVPVRPQGDVPVIVRLVWATHEELLPARAIRWTTEQVMVIAKAPGAPSNAHELICWLRADDVYRTIPRRPWRGAGAGTLNSGRP